MQLKPHMFDVTGNTLSLYKLMHVYVVAIQLVQQYYTLFLLYQMEGESNTLERRIQVLCLPAAPYTLATESTLSRVTRKLAALAMADTKKC